MSALADGRLRFLWRWVPGLALLFACGWWLAPYDTPWPAMGLYALAFGWAVMLPGMLVHRALRGRPTTLLADVAFGGATGLVLQPLAWALLTALGVPQWQVFWPVPVVLAFALVPPLRKHWTITRYDRALHPATSWAVVLAAIIPIYSSIRLSVGRSVLPPAANSWYQDAYWHLSIVAETMRAVPPQMPQIAGREFSYHWFANAHVGAMTWTTGLDTALVFSRLWVFPIIILAMLGVAAVGQRLTGRAWPGALAALMTAAGPAIQPAWFGVYGATSFNALSPSQQFSIPLLLLALMPIVDALSGRRLSWGSWVLLGLAVLGVAGAKASVIPVLVCGLLLALAIALLRNRSLLRPTVVALGVVGVIGALTWPLVAGGGSGVRLQIFSTIKGMDPWSKFSGVPVVGGIALGLWPPGIEKSGGALLLVLLVISYLIAFLWLLVGIPVLRASHLAGWFLLGIGVAGFSAMMLLNQDGFSQVYFMSGAVVAWHLLTAWGMKLLVDKVAVRSSGWTIASAVLLGVSAGFALARFAREITGPYRSTGHINRMVATSIVCVVAMVAVWGLLAFVVRNRPAAPHVVHLVGAATLLGAAVPTVQAWTVADVIPFADQPQGSDILFVGSLVLSALSLAALIWFAGAHPGRRDRRSPMMKWVPVIVLAATVGISIVRVAPEDQPPSPPGRVVQPSEGAAALWLRDNTDRFAIVASNVHCVNKVTEPNCDARGYWVGAFSERRILVEGWAYTGPAHEAHGKDDLPYSRQPFDDPELFALNEAAFYAPTPEVLQRLRVKGVRYLFADSLAGNVSPRLEQLAKAVYANGPVTVYEL